MRKYSNILRWSSAAFLVGSAVLLAIAAHWTWSYWGSQSALAQRVRAAGTWEVLGNVLSADKGPLTERVGVGMALLGPYLAGLAALLALVLAFFQYRGRNVQRFTIAFATLLLPSVWLCARGMRALEDPIFFEASPWVAQFRARFYPMALLAGAYLILVITLLLIGRFRPSTSPSGSQPAQSRGGAQ